MEKEKLAFYKDIRISEQGNVVAYRSSNTKITEPTTVMVKSDDAIGKVAAWGGNNNFPNEMVFLANKDGVTRKGLSTLGKSHYGSGLTLVKESYEDEKRKRTPISLLAYPEIKKFFRDTKFNFFIKDTITDLEWWSLAFPEYKLSPNYNKITRVYRQETALCRFEIMNEKGFVPRVWKSYKWDEAVNLKSKDAVSIPLISPLWTTEEIKAYCKKNKIKNFCKPINYSMVNEGYYPFTDWHAAKEWIEISISIPEFKKAMFKNQANITFLIEISEDYFKRKYGNSWVEEFDEDKREEIRDNFSKELDAKINSQKNAGVSIQSIMYLDANGKPESSIKITPIDNKFKEGMYLPEASAARSEQLASMGLDVSLIGSGMPGGKILNGSGSDKRIALSILQTMMKSNREYTTEIFEFIKEWNDWPEEISAVFEDTNITTLDKNPTGTQNTITA